MPHQRATDRRVLQLAEAQHGVVARRQLLALGLTHDTIVHRRLSGRLVALHRGVFALGHRALRPEGRWMAAVLACGSTAVLSHRSAAALWDLRVAASTIDVTVPSSAGRKRRGAFAVHRVPGLTASQVTTLRGVPVTAAHRTLLDLAGCVDAAALRRAVERADQLELFDLRRLRPLLDAHPRRPGVPALEALLQDYSRHGMTYTRSRLQAPVLGALMVHDPTKGPRIAGSTPRRRSITLRRHMQVLRVAIASAP